MEQIMLNESKVTANIPAADLERARRFYADKLGLTPAQEDEGGLVYTTAGGTTFLVYKTEYAGQTATRSPRSTSRTSTPRWRA
jgi:catechol 2,3-dioxygenase-like lactoylglutathione lyase family enzyme